VEVVSVPFFGSPQNFLDPKLTKDGKPYGPERYKSLVKNLYIISKNTYTSYTDLRDKITPSEMTALLNLIHEENEETKRYVEKLKKDRKKDFKGGSFRS
jgi:hypothetical protein